MIDFLLQVSARRIEGADIVPCELAKSDLNGMWLSDETMIKLLQGEPYKNIQFCVLIKKK